MAYNIINLAKVYKAIGENETKNKLKEFKCSLNKDVEYFIKEKAIEFSKQGIAETFLVTTSYRKQEVIVGYFSLTSKPTKVRKDAFGGKMKKRFSRFAQYDTDKKYFLVSLPLIGQIGKNYYNKYNELITGDDLLKMACDKIKIVQEIVGGRFVFLECEDKPRLKEFYEDNGFVCFGKRSLERDERDKNSGDYLLQMLKDLTNN